MGMNTAAPGADYWPQDRPFADVPTSNPFEIGPLLVFAAIFAAATIASAVLVSHFGSSGLLATTALTGAVDVDVAVLAALQAGRDVLPLDVIGKAILVAMATNALCRAGIAILLGPPSFSAPFTALTVRGLCHPHRSSHAVRNTFTGAGQASAGWNDQPTVIRRSTFVFQ